MTTYNFVSVQAFERLKHVVVPYVENTLYSASKYSWVRQVHTHCIRYFTEHNEDDEPHDFEAL